MCLRWLSCLFRRSGCIFWTEFLRTVQITSRQGTYAVCETNALVFSRKYTHECREEGTSKDNCFFSSISHQSDLSLAVHMTRLVDIDSDVLEWDVKLDVVVALRHNILLIQILVCDRECKVKVQRQLVASSVCHSAYAPVLAS